MFPLKESRTRQFAGNVTLGVTLSESLNQISKFTGVNSLRRGFTGYLAPCSRDVFLASYFLQLSAWS